MEWRGHKIYRDGITWYLPIAMGVPDDFDLLNYLVVEKFIEFISDDVDGIMIVRLNWEPVVY